MPTLVEALLAIIKYAPGAITEATQLYNAVKADLSETDIQKIDAALADAQAQDAAATLAADKALDPAAQR